LAARRRPLASKAECDYNDQNGHFGAAMGEYSWTVAEAKAKLSEVIEQAEAIGPQIITRHGRTAVVVVAAEEWARKTRRSGNLAEFFAGSPLRDSGLKVQRRKDTPRKVEL
jgi:prevent-host-death family protein